MPDKASHEPAGTRGSLAAWSGSVDSERQWRVFGCILAILIGVMLGAAVALPESPDALPSLIEIVVNAVCSIPNIEAFASRANSPGFVRSYLAIGLLATVLCTVAFISLRGHDQPMAPFPSGNRKVLVIAGLFMLVGLVTSVWWNPGIPQKAIGLLQGRWGAFMHVALSSRTGAATVGTAIFFVGPYMLTSVLWVAIRRPNL